MDNRWIMSGLVVGLLAIRATAETSPASDITYSDIDDDFYQEQYHVLRAATERALPASIATVSKSEIFAKSLELPAPYQLRAPLIIEIRVIPEDSLYHGLEGTAGWEERDGHWVHVLTLNIASYIQNPKEDISALLSHEYAHILLADILGVDPRTPLPSWLNEGIAQSVTSEGKTRVTELQKELRGAESMLKTCDLDAPVDSFAHGEGNFECYPEYYVAMRTVTSIGGPTAIGRVLKELPEHKSFADAFEKATGHDYAEFQEKVDRLMVEIIHRRAVVP